MTQQGPQEGSAQPTPPSQPDTSGVENLIDEGGPLEPSVVEEVEAAPAASDELATAVAELAERTADVQRVQAEYQNYKRRVDRDRDLVKQNATFAVLAPMLDVLDDIDRAREAGELEGGFKSVAEKFERVVATQGLIKYGAEGDPFDPTLHEAISHMGTDPSVEVTTCRHIALAGYRIGERVVRAAKVVVVDPETPNTTDAAAPEASAEDAN